MAVFRDWNSINIHQKYVRKADPAFDQEEKLTDFLHCLQALHFIINLVTGLKSSLWLDLAKGYSSPAFLIYAQSLI